jgi:hypothetical protein
VQSSREKHPVPYSKKIIDSTPLLRYTRSQACSGMPGIACSRFYGILAMIYSQDTWHELTDHRL